MDTLSIIKSLNSIKDKYLIVGVSAGPDSMALLHMVKNNTDKIIVCVHINHNVRKESNQEEKYLKEYCNKNSILFETMKIASYNNNNFEDEARQKRYAFYEQVLKKYKSHTLLLAHHGDDLIETIIMKIIRGSNLEGYAGIKMRSKQKDYWIIRPLLNMTKEDILKYNKENNIKYYLDKSNDDKTYTRNRIRAEILPLLKKEDTLIHQKFLKYSNTLQEYYNYIEDVTTKKIKTKYKNNIIDITSFNKEHPFIQKNIIFYILSNIYDNKSNIIKDKHIDDIIALANNNKPNLTINLPHNYVAIKSYNKIIFEKKKDKEENYKIVFDKECKIGNIVIKKVNKIDTNGNDVCRLNSNNITLPLYLRNKKSGDYISLFNTNGTKKIKDIFIDSKLSKNIRDNYPLLVDDNDNILWIPNIKKSKYNVKKGDFCDIILTSYEEREGNNNEN